MPAVHRLVDASQMLKALDTAQFDDICTHATFVCRLDGQRVVGDVPCPAIQIMAALAYRQAGEVAKAVACCNKHSSAAVHSLLDRLSADTSCDVILLKTRRRLCAAATAELQKLVDSLMAQL